MISGELSFTVNIYSTSLCFSFRMELLVSKRSHIREEWSEICETYSVPDILHDHQIDTINLLLSNEHVFCGLPTGSGKTLAQLATVLFTKGTALVIPPLITIETQMSEVCQKWGIRFLNLSSFSEDLDAEIQSTGPRIIIASVEKISDSKIQKSLLNLKLDYVAFDEAQVQECV